MILDDLVAVTKKRVAKEKEMISLAALKQQVAQLPVDETRPFEKALKKSGMSIIAEVKKASPSKGIIAEQFPYVEIAEKYDAAGADAISVLTEPEYFLGSLDYLKEIVQHVQIPVLRKDFTIDEYMIYQAKLAGASAVLLIVSILTKPQLQDYLNLAESLGMSALVEAHDENEIKTAIEVGAKIIGVNNRNLKDFSVDFSNSERLRQLVPDDCIYVAESGVKQAQDTQVLRQHDIHVALVGETLMKSDDKKKMLADLKEPMSVDQS